MTLDRHPGTLLGRDPGFDRRYTWAPAKRHAGATASSDIGLAKFIDGNPPYLNGNGFRRGVEVEGWEFQGQLNRGSAQEVRIKFHEEM